MAYAAFIMKTGFLCLLALLFAGHSIADERPTVSWLSIDRQPAWIDSGPLANKGYAQTIEQLLQDRLTGFRHQAERVIYVRIYSTLKNRDACFAASPYQGVDLPRELLDNLVFSAPTFLFFYHGIILRTESDQKISKHLQDNMVDLRSVMADQTLKGSFQPGRNYSRWLNEIFAEAPDTANLLRWAGTDQLTQSMFRMMAAKRLDYFIDYSFMLKYQETSKNLQNQYRFIPLVQHKGKFGLGSVACNDTPVGRKLIARINEILPELRTTKEYRDAVSLWLAPPGEEALYKHLWETELQTRLK